MPIEYLPTIRLTAKEAHILVQALRIAEEADILDYAKQSEINNLKVKLQNVK